MLVNLLANTTITVPELPTALHCRPTQTASHLAQSRSVRIGVVRFEKKFKEVEGLFWFHVHDRWEKFPNDAKVKLSLFKKSSKTVSASTPSSVCKKKKKHKLTTQTDDGVDAETFLLNFLNKLNITFASFGNFSQQKKSSKRQLCVAKPSTKRTFFHSPNGIF